MSHEEKEFLSLPRYPALIDLQQVCWLLGIKLHQGDILVQKRLLVPVGKRRIRKARLFATAYVLELAGDLEWLAKVKDTVSLYWEKVNANKDQAQQGGIP